MTHTAEFIQEGGKGRREGEREEERPASSSHLKIISGNKPGKRLWWSLAH